MSTNKKWLLYLVPLAVGGFFAWRILRKKKDDGAGAIEKDNSSDSGSFPASTSVYPLKKGSRGEEVKQLQRAIIAFGNPNLLKSGDDDGIFGTRTEAALFSLLGKKTAMASDIEELKARKIAADKESAKLTDTAKRIALAKKLIDLATKTGNDFVAIVKTWVGSGSITTDGRYVPGNGGFYDVGAKVFVDSGAKMKYDANGFITVSSGGKYYFINPLSFEVK